MIVENGGVIACVVAAVVMLVCWMGGVVWWIRSEKRAERRADEETRILDLTGTRLGARRVNVITIPAGKSCAIGGKVYRAAQSCDMQIITKADLSEISICAGAKMRDGKICASCIGCGMCDSHPAAAEKIGDMLTAGRIGTLAAAGELLTACRAAAEMCKNDRGQAQREKVAGMLDKAIREAGA